jgi:hypothetical protein
METFLTDRTFKDTKALRGGLKEMFKRYKFDLFATLTTPKNITLEKLNSRIKRWVYDVVDASTLQVAFMGVAPTYDRIHAHLLVIGQSRRFKSFYEGFGHYQSSLLGISFNAFDAIGEKEQNKMLTEFLGKYWKGRCDFQFIGPTDEDSKRVIDYITCTKNVNPRGWEQLTPYGSALLNKRRIS